jgi:hypothetical protein
MEMCLLQKTNPKGYLRGVLLKKRCLLEKNLKIRYKKSPEVANG